MSRFKNILFISLLFIITIVLTGCELELDDFSILCDDGNGKCEYYSGTSVLGSDIQPTEQIINACNNIFHSDEINIRLYTCTGEHEYKNPNSALPGGAYQTIVNGDSVYMAKDTITFTDYMKGAFAGEISLSTDEKLYEYMKLFVIIYKNVFLYKGEDKVNKGEIKYRAGSCVQNYKAFDLKNNTNTQEKIDILNRLMSETKYLILVDQDTGNITYTRYSVASGYVNVTTKASRDGLNYLQIFEKVKQMDTLSKYYKNSVIYDCRNLNNGGKLDDEQSTWVTDNDYGKGTWVYHNKKDPELSKYYSDSIAFAEYVPEKAVSSGDSLPLIIWLHGLYESESYPNSSKGTFLKSGMLGVVSNWNLKNIPAIIIAPRSYNQNWANNRNYDSIEAMIKYAIDKYNIDTNRIVLMGHSMGGNGVIKVGYNLKDYFSALVPMSASLTSFDGMDTYFSKIPMKGYVENDKNHKPQMQKFFENTGHSGNLTVLDVSHGYIPSKAFTIDNNKDGVSDLIAWALSQRKN